jgi:hypothetical protein
MTAADSKTLEFARLFELFERLTSRKTHDASHHDDNITSGMDDARSVPPDLAPVVKSLAAIMGTRKVQDEARQKRRAAARTHNNAGTSASHDMMDGEMDGEEGYEDEESLAKFPLGTRYPFTFRLMLHKLYQLDDWAQKVKEVLERSQIEFKSLAEQDMEVEKVERPRKKSEGHVHFKQGVASGGNRKPATRPRSHSVAVDGKGGEKREKGPISPLKSPKRYREPPPEESRAVKKRCVGRRKSVSGPISTEPGRIKGVWVYDAAVSSIEFTGRETMEHAVPRRPRYQSLGTTAKKIGKEPQQNGEGMAARRALSVLDNTIGRLGGGSADEASLRT